MAAPQSTALPTAPQRNEGEADFISKSNAFVAALEPFRVDLQAQADFNNTSAIDALASKEAAKASELLAFSAGNYIGVWASLTGSVTAGQSVAHNNQYWGALVNIADITADEPGVSSDWQVAGYELGILTGQIPTADNLSMVGATENFTSNNLNSNVFFASGTNDIIVQGYAQNSTTAIFLFPTTQSGLSITQAGAFSVKTSGLVVYGSAVTLSVSTLGSSKTMVVFATISGATSGQNLILTADSASSSITVNY
jgi:hypothetical protein